MKSQLLGASLVGLLCALGFAACSSDFNGFPLGGLNLSGGSIVCNPNGFFDVSSPSGLDASAVLFDSSGDPDPGHSVNLAFGSAVTTVTNLNDGSTLDPSGDSAITEAAGNIDLEMDCNELGNNANPCSVTFSTTVTSVQAVSCNSTFF